MESQAKPENTNQSQTDKLYSASWISSQLHSGAINQGKAVEMAISKLLSLARACGLRLELQRDALSGALSEVEDDLLRFPNRRKGMYD